MPGILIRPHRYENEKRKTSNTPYTLEASHVPFLATGCPSPALLFPLTIISIRGPTLADEAGAALCLPGLHWSFWNCPDSTLRPAGRLR